MDNLPSQTHKVLDEGRHAQVGEVAEREGADGGVVVPAVLHERVDSQEGKVLLRVRVVAEEVV